MQRFLAPLVARSTSLGDYIFSRLIFTNTEQVVSIVTDAVSLGTVSLVVGMSSFIFIASNYTIDTPLFLATSFTVGSFLYQSSNHIQTRQDFTTWVLTYSNFVRPSLRGI